MPAEMNIEGAFTFASKEVLTSKFEQALKAALKSAPHTEFVLGIKTNFLDSNAKLLLLRFIKGFRRIHESPEKGNIRVEWTSPKGDNDILELGLLAQEASSLPFVFETA